MTRHSSFDVIIPARFGSERLPGKPLLDVGGHPLIEHVYRCASQSRARRITVATDDARVREAVEAFGGNACMTGEHRSGTDRLAEAVQHLGLGPGDVVVNVQGDEPEMPPALIDQLAAVLADDDSIVMATACAPFTDAREFHDRSVVKVVRNRLGDAMYFSRAPIPARRDPGEEGGGAPEAARRHIGIYAYRAGFIRRYAALAPAPLEALESLEQLRVLWHGGKIRVCDAIEIPGPGIDTPSDLEAARRRLGGRATASRDQQAVE